jgi:hypothetical protein
MLGGNIDVSFPKNLRDPMNADPAPVGFRISSLHSHQALRVWHFVLPPSQATAWQAVLVLESGY